MRRFLIILAGVLSIVSNVDAQNVMRVQFKDNTYQDIDVNLIDNISWFHHEYAYFSNTSKILRVGDSFTQKVTTNSDGKVTYSSSNTSVAKVNKTTGEVTALSNGDVTITAKIASTSSFGALKAKYTIIVEGGIQFDGDDIVATGGYSDVYISKAKLQMFINIPEDVTVYQAGIYYSTNSNPDNTNGQTVIANNTSTTNSEYYLAIDQLEMNKRYYYKAFVYVPTTATYYYGETRSFVTENIQSVTNGDAIDLGLSVKWCSHNLGATKPEDFGTEYGWGELTPFSGTYAYYSNGSYIDIGNNICGTNYDVAKYVLGGTWQLPSYSELLELFEKCAYAKTEYNGVPGYIIEGDNRNSIFVPYGISNIYSGYHTNPDGSTLHYYADFSGFMTGELSTSSGNTGRVYSLMFDNEKGYLWYSKATVARNLSQAVRPICK